MQRATGSGKRTEIRYHWPAARRRPREAAIVPPSWIELLPWFRCNCSCVVCTGSKLPSAPGMSTAEVNRWLEDGRRRGIDGAWFGGGEPTLRPDLVPLVARARALGYRRIRIQTNGMRLSYPPFLRACIEAGTTEVSVSVKGVDARSHDALTRVRGSFARLTAAVRALAASGVPVEADVLLTTRSLPQLARIVECFAGLGARAFLFRLLSRHGFDGDDGLALLPDLRAVAPRLAEAFARADARGLAASSLHTPPCTLGPGDRSRYRHAGDWNVLVVPPGGPPFMAADTPMEGGAFLPGCARCTARPQCLGPRADYLAAHGGDAFVPLGRQRRTAGRARPPAERVRRSVSKR
jgi:MoaA/NifB/PqqE/SkfB family radical SAM enzyme